MNLREKISSVINSSVNDAEIERYLCDVRESLAESNKQFLIYATLYCASLLTHYLVIYKGGVFTFNNIAVTDTSLFRRVFLVVPSGLLAYKTAIGYLRRWQRDVYDYICISRCSVLGQTGLHELRLPSDHILGLFVLRTEGGVIGRLIANTSAFISMSAFVFFPMGYIINEAIINISLFGVSDVLSFLASVSSILFCVFSFTIICLAGKIKF